MRAGDIAAAIGLKDVTTGETLCAENASIILERMEFPDPASVEWVTCCERIIKTHLKNCIFINDYECNFL